MKPMIKIFSFSLYATTLLLSCNQKAIANTIITTLHAKLADNPVTFVQSKKANPSSTISGKNKNNQKIEWIADDGTILIMEHGRLIQSMNIPNGDLVSIKSEKPDPIALGLLKSTTPKTWTRQANWSDVAKKINMTSVFKYEGKKSVLIKNYAVDTHLFVEKVTIPALKKTFLNKFWLDIYNGEVIKSVQQIKPNQPAMTFSLIKTLKEN